MGYLLILAIILLGGALATLGDRVGSRVGKARLSLFNLRPKKTAVLITILTGSLISASTMGILLATSRQFRDAVFRIGEIRRQLQDKREQQRQLLQERKLVLKAKEQSEDELAIARAELTESIRRLRTVNRSLRTAQQRQRNSAVQLKQLQARFRQEQQKLQRAKTQGTALRSKIQSLSAEELRLQSERQRLLVQRNQTQERLRQVETQRQAAAAAVVAARSQLQQAEQQLRQADQQLQQAEQRLGEANQQRTALLQQRAQLQQDIWSLERGLQQANQQLQLANQQRTVLVQQRTQLQQEIRSLEQERKQLARNLEKLLLGIRLGNVAIRPGQVLAFDVFEGSKNRTQIWAQLNQLVRRARTNAIVLTNPANLTANDEVIRFQPNTINRLVTQLSDGQAYVVRFLAAANYLAGEESVLVIPQVAPYRLVFKRNTAIATLSLTPSSLSDEEILAQLQDLFQAVNRQAIQAGVLPDPTTRTVGTFRQIDLFRFVLALKERNDDTPITIAAITTDPVFTSDPLPVNLVARKDGVVILRAR